MPSAAESPRFFALSGNPSASPRRFPWSPLCNRHPERAPRVGPFSFPLCWRCIGAATAIVMGRVWLPDHCGWLAALAVLPLLLPAYIDGVAQYEYGKQSTNPRRLWTGFLLGAALAVLAAAARTVTRG